MKRRRHNYAIQYGIFLMRTLKKMFAFLDVKGYPIASTRQFIRWADASSVTVMITDVSPV